MGIKLKKPERNPNLQLTERDKICIWAAYHHRIISTDELMLLTGTTSRTAFNLRLSELWGNDYLDRSERIAEIFAFEDERPATHLLGTAGAEWLTREHGIHFPNTIDWKRKNKEIKSVNFVKHHLGTSKTMVHIQRDIEAVPALRMSHPEEVWLNSPRYNRRTLNPFKLPTEYEWRDGKVVKRNTVMDYTFGLFDGRGEQPTKGLNFLEFDTGTESFVRTASDQTDIMKKYFGYADARKRGLVKDIFGYKAFRALFVVDDNQRRVDGMIDTYKNHAADRIPAGSLLFTTLDMLIEKGFFGPIWLNGKGVETPILDGMVEPLIQSSLHEQLATEATYL